MTDTTDSHEEQIPVPASDDPSQPITEKRRKVSYVGAPVIFILDQACRQLNEAYAYCDIAQVYQVGSSLQRADWRDVDLRMMMSDADFEREFPDAHGNGAWEMDAKWTLLTAAISVHLSKLTGLPIDFQFQPMTFANEHHRGRRQPMGLHLCPKNRE